MRCDPTANDRVPVTMIANLRMLLDKTPFEFAAGIAAIVGRWATTEGGLRCSLITAPARRQKNDCRQQIVRTERHQQIGGWHLRHAKFHFGTQASCPRFTGVLPVMALAHARACDTRLAANGLSSPSIRIPARSVRLFSLFDQSRKFTIQFEVVV